MDGSEPVLFNAACKDWFIRLWEDLVGTTSSGAVTLFLAVRAEWAALDSKGGEREIRSKAVERWACIPGRRNSYRVAWNDTLGIPAMEGLTGERNIPLSGAAGS